MPSLQPATYIAAIVIFIVVLISMGLWRVFRLEYRWEQLRSAPQVDDRSWIAERGDGEIDDLKRRIGDLEAIKGERRLQALEKKTHEEAPKEQKISGSSAASQQAEARTGVPSSVEPKRRGGRSPYPDYMVFAGVRSGDGRIATYNRIDVERLSPTDRDILFFQHMGMSEWYAWPWDR